MTRQPSCLQYPPGSGRGLRSEDVAGPTRVRLGPRFSASPPPLANLNRLGDGFATAPRLASPHSPLACNGLDSDRAQNRVRGSADPQNAAHRADPGRRDRKPARSRHRDRSSRVGRHAALALRARSARRRPTTYDASPTQSPTLTTGGPMNGVRSWVLRVGRHRSEEDRTCPITS